MINKTRVMLYVDDVEKISEFWVDYFQAKIESKIDLPDDSQTIDLQVTQEFQLSLFEKEFIKKYSPEVLGNVPSIMFFADNFQELHSKIPNAGEIIENAGVNTFNFADPEGNYFVIAES